MNKTKLVALSLMTAATLTMVGCGSSSSTTTVTPPADTNDTNTTPVVVVPDYAKPAPISAISAQVLVNNAAAIQASNTASAMITSMTSALSAMITEAGAIALINNFAGDAQCAAITAGGSGSIHAEAHSLAAGGNGYTITFNECKLDTGVTLATTASNKALRCPALEKDIRIFSRPNGDGTTKNISNKRIKDFVKDMKSCSDRIQNDLEQHRERYTDGNMNQLVSDLAYVTGLYDLFADAADEAGLGRGDLGVLAINNDILTIDKTLKAEVNLNAGTTGNIWTTTFSAENFSAVVTDKTEATDKITIAMNGNLAGDLSSLTSTDLNTNIRTQVMNVSGTNNLTSTVETALPNQGTGVFISFGVQGEAATYAADFDMTRLTNLHANFDPVNPWRNHIESNFNDSGDGYMVAYFNNLQNAYNLQFSLYNKAFVQERKLETDPLAVFGVGVARDATLDVNGEIGMNSAGIPFALNTQGAFTFVTDTTASRTILNDGTTTPNLAGGYMRALGAGGEITFEFSPNSDILMSVNGGLHTQLNSNTALWVQNFPQP